MKERSEVVEQHERFLPTLAAIAKNLEAQLKDRLDGIAHIDRVYFRAKSHASFSEKCRITNDDGEFKYASPHEEMEDLVAGRVLVFFKQDIEIVREIVLSFWSRVEQETKAPKRVDSFSYESEHFIFQIPPDATPDNWDEQPERPTTFELQIRTLFMHAWAEPNHNLAYKPPVPLTPDEERKLAWAAASAWGGDETLQQVFDSIQRRASEGAN